MSSVPDDHWPHHDGSPSPAAVPVPAQDVALLALVKRFSPAGWQILHPHAQHWEAFRQRGSEQRTIVASSVITLYARLARVASEDADQPTGTYPDPVAAYVAHLGRLGAVWTDRP